MAYSILSKYICGRKEVLFMGILKLTYPNICGTYMNKGEMREKYENV